jgi:hypothetical protein
VGVNTLNLEVATLEEVTEAIGKAAGFVIGSPTLGGHMPTQVPRSPPFLCLGEQHYWFIALELCVRRLLCAVSAGPQMGFC